MNNCIVAIINSLNLKAQIKEDGTVEIRDPKTGEVYRSEEITAYKVPGIRFASDNGNEIKFYNSEAQDEDSFGEKAPIACFSGFGLSGKDPAAIYIRDGVKYIKLPGKNENQVIEFRMGKENRLGIYVSKEETSWNYDLFLSQSGGDKAVYGSGYDFDNDEIKDPHTISLDDFTEEECVKLITESLNNSSNSTEDTKKALAYCEPLLRMWATEFKEHWKTRTTTKMNKYREAILESLKLKTATKEDGTVEIRDAKTGEIYKMKYELHMDNTPGAHYTSKTGKEIWLYTENPGACFYDFCSHSTNGYNEDGFGVYPDETYKTIDLPCEGHSGQYISFIAKEGKPLQIIVTTGQFKDDHDLELTQNGDKAVYGERYNEDRLENPHTISFDDFTEDGCIQLITQCIDNYPKSDKNTRKALAYTDPVLRMYAREFIEAWRKRINDVKDDDTDYGSSGQRFGQR